MNTRQLALLWLASVGTAGSVHAQDTTAVRDSVVVEDSTDVLVVDHSFTAPGEFVRVFLQKGEVYRAELTTADVSLDVHPRPSGPPAFVSRTEESGAGGRLVFEIYPRTDKEHEITVLGLGDAVVRLQLYHDFKASQRRRNIINQPGWEIGVEAAGGYHSGYLLNLDPAVTDDVAKGSWDVEGCFSARSGPGIARVLSGCAIGIGWHNRPESTGVLWFFIEPRLRILGGKPRGQSNTEVGALFRVAIGEVNKSNINPFMLAPGAYLSRHLRSGPTGKGWSFTLAYAHMFISNLGNKMGSGFSTTESFGSQEADRMTFAIGWYQ
jgi:hypothetical protein